MDPTIKIWPIAIDLIKAGLSMPSGQYPRTISVRSRADIQLPLIPRNECFRGYNEYKTANWSCNGLIFPAENDTHADPNWTLKSTT